uniref:Uncharacterized protein n=1 Tax=Rhizophora mucronata TaxID=61149 RepID=A0A2P2NHH1_RHIMU
MVFQKVGAQIAEIRIQLSMLVPFLQALGRKSMSNHGTITAITL